MKKERLFGLNLFEFFLWAGSVTMILLTFLLVGESASEVVIASLIGATALIFVSKGHPVGQILTVLFALIYGYISLKFRYYGEMITYLGMTAPIAVASAVSLFRNPYQKGRAEVKVRQLRRGEWSILLVLTVIVTTGFYFILKIFDTPNLFWSTVSVATSFSASVLTLLRSPFYALAYAANDIVLIVLWVLASVIDPGYIPMVICFVIFLMNDTYGFWNWSRMKRHQSTKMFEKSQTK